MIFSNLITQFTTALSSILPGPIADIFTQIFAPILALFQGIGL